MMTKVRLEEIKRSLQRDQWLSGNEGGELIAEVEELQAALGSGPTAKLIAAQAKARRQRTRGESGRAQRS